MPFNCAFWDFTNREALPIFNKDAWQHKAKQAMSTHDKCEQINLNQFSRQSLMKMGLCMSGAIALLEK